MLTSRDKKILKFMEYNGLGLTINQAAMMFFPKKFSYYYARTRLRYLWHDMKVIKRFTNEYTGEIVYYFDKPPTIHSNAIMNIYANLINAGYNITEFKTEKEWLGKYKSDAFIVAENENEIRIFIVEVDLTSVTNIKKYEELYGSRELQNKYGDFPMVIILTDIKRGYKSNNFEIVQIDIRCSDFQKVLI